MSGSLFSVAAGTAGRILPWCYLLTRTLLELAPDN